MKNLLQVEFEKKSIEDLYHDENDISAQPDPKLWEDIEPISKRTKAESQIRSSKTTPLKDITDYSPYTPKTLNIPEVEKLGPFITTTKNKKTRESMEEEPQTSFMSTAATGKKRRFNYSGEPEPKSLEALLKREKEEMENAKKQLKTRAIEDLGSWINARITGYLIFANSINDSLHHGVKHSHKKEKGIHLNSLTGKKWKSLTEEEREEYRQLAIKYRIQAKNEIKEKAGDMELSEIIEQLEKSFKKLKKEPQ